MRGRRRRIVGGLVTAILMLGLVAVLPAAERRARLALDRLLDVARPPRH